jgi:hypothetical protein
VRDSTASLEGILERFPAAGAVSLARTRARFRALSLSDRVLVVALFSEFALVALHGLNKVLFQDGTLLALDSEANLGTWFSTSQLLIAAMAWAAMALSDRARRVVWGSIALLLSVLSLDEIAQFHERIEELNFDLTRFVLLPFVAFAVIALFLQATRHLDPRPRRLVWIGAAVLAASQGATSANGYFDFPNAVQAALVIFEDWSEMVMGTFMLAAASEAARDSIIAWAVRAAKR